MRAHVLQSNFTAGVLSPVLAARLDLQQYYNACKVGNNVLFRPQGGVRRRGGMRHRARLPFTLTRLTGMTITCPRGGTTANANDNSESTEVDTTTNIGVLNPYVVVHYDLGSALKVNFADAHGLYLDVLAGATSAEFAIQYSTDNVTFTTLGTALEKVDTTSRTYRRGSVGTGVTARYWRIARIGATDLTTAQVKLKEFSLWVETSTVSEVRLFPFQFDVSTEYLLAVTDYNIAVFSAGTVVANLRAPYASADLAELDYAQAANTAILVHEDYAPQRLLRNTSGAWWGFGALEFTSAARYDFNDASSPTPTSCVQGIQLTGGTWAAGDKFKLDVDGALTGEIVYAGDANANEQAKTVENIRREVQKLWTVGYSGIVVARTGALTYSITFGGDSADSYDLVVGVPVTGNASNRIAATFTTAGVSRWENAWSAARGWPRSVSFHEGRLWFGGTRDLPTSVFASRTSSYYDFDTGEGLDDDPLFFTIATDQLNAVQAIHAGRDLQVFTTGAEFYFPESPVTPGNGVLALQTRYGSKRIRPVSIDGSTLFVQRTGKVLRQFVYGQEEDAYAAPPVSVLASHLLNNVVDVTAWQGDGDDESNLVVCVNGDGTAAVLNTLRSQDINAWASWSTGTATIPGLFKAVSAVGQLLYFATKRTFNSVPALFLEEHDLDYYLDSATQGTNGPASTTIATSRTELTCTLRCRADGKTLNDVALTSGNGTAAYAVTAWEVGVDWNPTITTMPLNVPVVDGNIALRKKRVVKARVHLNASLGVRVNNRELIDLRTDVGQFDTAPAAFTGAKEIDDSTNWSWEPLTYTIDQVDPMPFEVLGLDLQLETE